MPITRRKRATSPEQPEQPQATSDQIQQESTPETPLSAAGGTESSTEQPQKEAAQEGEQAPRPQRLDEAAALAPTNYQHPALNPHFYPQNTFYNGENQQPRAPREYHEGAPRRQSFRRQSQQASHTHAHQAPTQQQPAAALQPPSHEIKLPLGKSLGDTTGDTLHLSYNPGYTKAEEVRASLLTQLVAESKAGGRARCWNCGSLAIVYDSWNTQNKTFGEIGIAYCEICGVWSVL